ncbi:MAG TPA: glutamine synthetase [Chloroflexi bacterium]|nr:glutamine synthetase [Chloroflexota bacterium]
MDGKDVLARCAEDNVKFVSFQFSDIIGNVKSVDAPLDQVAGALQNGIWFDGSSVEGFARVQEGDMQLIPDADTYAVLPWTPEHMKRARIFCDIHTPDGDSYSKDPRGALKRVIARFAEKGWRYDIGPEPEFFLFRPNGSVHPVPHDVGGYFDFSPDDDAVRVRTELMAALDQMGLKVEVGHHEVALGQHEIDFRFADALRTADNVLTLKYTVKAIAAQHGLVASFMPKPIFGVNGSGMHCHQSISDSDGTNLFYDAEDEFGLSEIAYGLIAGQLKHARAMAAVIAPTVNSYKRLVPGYEAPTYVGWAQVNRSAMIRIPRYNPGQTYAARAELRCPDPSSNPYLAFAAMGAAALDGIENGLKPMPPLNGVNIFELTDVEKRDLQISELPGSLKEALYELHADEVIRAGLGEEIYDVFLRAKLAEWDEYRMQVMDWEIERYLERA